MTTIAVFIAGMLAGVLVLALALRPVVRGMNNRLRWHAEADEIVREATAVYKASIEAIERGDQQETRRLEARHKELRQRLNAL